MHHHFLCSPARMKWVKEEHAPVCIFCGIVKGDKRIPNKVLFKNADFIVVMNIFPYNTGHLQVSPIKHITKLEDFTDTEVSKLFILVKKCQKLLNKVLVPMGYNVGINQGGVCSGASVDHLHVHIVPRFKSDFGFMEVIARTKVLPESVDNTFKRLKRHVKMLE